MLVKFKRDYRLHGAVYYISGQIVLAERSDHNPQGVICEPSKRVGVPKTHNWVPLSAVTVI